MELRGKVVTGRMKASFFTELDWVREQCAGKLGFEPFPGTLNLEIIEQDLKLLDNVKSEIGVELIPTDQNFCAAKALPVVIGGLDAAVIVPADDVNIHGEKIIEILSGEKLRSALGLADGDLVTIKFAPAEQL